VFWRAAVAALGGFLLVVMVVGVQSHKLRTLLPNIDVEEFFAPPSPKDIFVSHLSPNTEGAVIFAKAYGIDFVVRDKVGHNAIDSEVLVLAKNATPGKLDIIERKIEIFYRYWQYGSPCSVRDVFSGGEARIFDFWSRFKFDVPASLLVTAATNYDCQICSHLLNQNQSHAFSGFGIRRHRNGNAFHCGGCSTRFLDRILHVDGLSFRTLGEAARIHPKQHGGDSENEGEQRYRVGNHVTEPMPGPRSEGIVFARMLVPLAVLCCLWGGLGFYYLRAGWLRRLSALALIVGIVLGALAIEAFRELGSSNECDEVTGCIKGNAKHQEPARWA